MKYLLLIYDEESRWQQLSEAEREASLGEYFQLSRDLVAAGKLHGGEELQPVASASTLRVRGGRAVVSDGPFAEAREQLGGRRRVSRFDATSLESADLVSQRVWALVQKRDALRTHDIVTIGALVECASLSGDGKASERKV